jgi:2-isopropylmalate synthase
MVKLRVGDRYEITADEGDGPVHALDRALRKALEVFYPTLAGVRLIDYKVRVMDTGKATAALVRVLIESSDGKNVWTTVEFQPILSTRPFTHWLIRWKI